jgi:hypothetical protein
MMGMGDKRTKVWTRLWHIALCMAVAYPLSMYPVFWIYRIAVPPNRRPAAIAPAIDKLYWPLEKLTVLTSGPLSRMLDAANRLVP